MKIKRWIGTCVFIGILFLKCNPCCHAEGTENQKIPVEYYDLTDYDKADEAGLPSGMDMNYDDAIGKARIELCETYGNHLDRKYYAGQDALVTFSDVNVHYVAKNNFPLVLGIMTVLLLLLLVAVAGVAYAKVMRQFKVKIEKANAAKSKFFARMSHDLRTPLNGILGIAELAMEETDATRLKEYMEKIIQSGEYLLGLINDTLDMQKIESGKMQLNPQPVHCAILLQEIVDMVRPSVEKKHIDFQIKNINANLQCYVKVDALHMKQILINLLSNALKFTPEKGRILLEIHCIERKNNISHVKIAVKDTGIGMSKEFVKEEIFKAFSQEKNELSIASAGTGLGLSIVKSLVELMGGTIKVESQLGKGSAFMIELDIERVEASEAQKSQTDSLSHPKVHQVLQGKHILLCEDHSLNAEIVVKVLERAGCETVWAENGAEGLRIFESAQKEYFDLILMDVRMPVMDGIEATKAIRGLPREDVSTIPIIAMTANAYDEDVELVIDAGMDGYLVKPVASKVLYETVSNYLKNQKN